MENGLARRGTIELSNHDTVRVKRFVHGFRYTLSLTNNVPQGFGRHVQNVLRKLLRNNQRMPFALRHEIHER